MTNPRGSRVNLGFSSASWVLFRTKSSNIFELVHGVVTARGFEGSFSGKVFFVVISNVGTSHVLKNNNDNNIKYWKKTKNQNSLRKSLYMYLTVTFTKKSKLQPFETKKKKIDSEFKIG